MLTLVLKPSIVALYNYNIGGKEELLVWWKWERFEYIFDIVVSVSPVELLYNIFCALIVWF